MRASGGIGGMNGMGMSVGSTTADSFIQEPGSMLPEDPFFIQSGASSVGDAGNMTTGGAGATSPPRGSNTQRARGGGKGADRDRGSAGSSGGSRPTDLLNPDATDSEI